MREARCAPREFDRFDRMSVHTLCKLATFHTRYGPRRFHPRSPHIDEVCACCVRGLVWDAHARRAALCVCLEDSTGCPSTPFATLSHSTDFVDSTVTLPPTLKFFWRASAPHAPCAAAHTCAHSRPPLRQRDGVLGGVGGLAGERRCVAARALCGSV